MRSAASPTTRSSTATSRKALSITLWVLQLLLASFVVMVGYSHALMPFDQIRQQATWMNDVPRGLATIMILAIPFHVLKGEASVTWMHALIAALAAFVAWGRWRKVPIAGR